MDFDTERRHVLFFEFTGQVALDEGRLADATVADENELEFGILGLCLERRRREMWVSKECSVAHDYHHTTVAITVITLTRAVEGTTITYSVPEQQKPSPRSQNDERTQSP
jgi:hypothetical protein